MKQMINIRYLVYGQLCFFVGFVICFLIRPIGLTNNAGLSFYGTMTITLVPYLIALLGPAFYFLRFALDLDVEELAIIKYAFISYAFFILGLSITPYTAGRYIADAHLTCGSILFSLQLLLSFWFIYRLHFVTWAIALTTLEFFAGLISFIYLSPKQGYLTETQFIFQICFSVVAYFSLSHLMPREKVASPLLHL